jgi:predicted ABC-type ATPase
VSSNGNTLTLAEHEEIYASIQAYYLAKSVPQTNPRAIITGGQPGSGKSRITSDAAAEFSEQGGFVIVDADKLRRFHPGYSKLLREDDTNAADLTHPDASGWARKLRRAGQEGRRNLIIDQTSKDPVVLIALANQLHTDGYIVELRVIAVSSLISEQRIYARYEQQKLTDGYGRFATKESHDLAYTELPNSVEAAELNKSVDTIKLYDKDHRLIYANEIKRGDWARTPEAKDALVQERNRPLSIDERNEYINGCEKLIILLREREARDDAVPYINNLILQARQLHYSDNITTHINKPMKQRLLVMNGQRLLQKEKEGQWVVEKVDKAGTIKPGVYNIYLAAQADKANTYDGVVMHSDKDYVYQRVDKGYIKHDRSSFDKTPGNGSAVSIKYKGNTAIISDSYIKQGRGLSR